MQTFATKPAFPKNPRQSRQLKVLRMPASALPSCALQDYTTFMMSQNLNYKMFMMI